MTKAVYRGNTIVQPATADFFLANFSPFDITNDYFDLYISNYKLDSPWMQQLRERVSPLRWLTIKDCTIGPGRGSGKVVIAGYTYLLRYAWRGLTEHDAEIGDCDWNQVLTWTARFELPEGENRDLKAEITKWKNQICRDEGVDVNPPVIHIPRSQWLEENFGITDNRLRSFRRHLQKEADQFFKLIEDPDNPDNPWRHDDEALNLMKDIHSPETIDQRVDAIRRKKTIEVDK